MLGVRNFSAVEKTEKKIERARRAAKNKILSKVFGDNKGDGGMLWGILHIKIIKCVGLRNLDKLSNLSFGALRGKRDLSDPYVEAFIDHYRLLKTKIYNDELNPVFDEEFFCPVAHYTEGVTFNVMDLDVISDEVLGKYILPVKELLKLVDDADMEEDPDLAPGDLKRVGLHKIVRLGGSSSSSPGKKKKDRGTLEFMIEFIPTRMLSKSPEVPGVYFHTTYGNDVKLYMNADDDGSAPIVKYGGINDDEKVWTPPRLWRDIYDAMCNAKQFIYAVGWSFDTDQYLLRGEELTKALAVGRYSPRIGELLKSKADEGLVVNLMQWDDYSSTSVTAGKMGTYDEKTRRFFSGTKVKARFMSMIGGETNTILQGQNKKMAFTHHQKFIIMDAPQVDGRGRELFAFIGGIDLTEGRWDNRQHPLFRTLQSNHKGDQYVKCFKTNPAFGPRQPWHDIHSAVRGPEAVHLVKAFEERWTKQADAADLVSLSRLDLDNEFLLENTGGWCTQLSRSIDSRVNQFNPNITKIPAQEFISEGLVDWGHIKEEDTQLSKRFETATVNRLSCSNYLDSKKGRLVDSSIHTTNIHQIRRAKHFIYIESQYFMGSSFMWEKNRDPYNMTKAEIALKMCEKVASKIHDNRSIKCGNMIAAEIALKICEKIAAKEPFVVYILLPMWMEGIPAAEATQGLLYFQRVTIEAMYKQVQDALNVRMANSSDYGLEVSDYLNIYCLGTRETSFGSEGIGEMITEDEKVLGNTRRHQIYIHSKMMIVDDDVVQIGTANINQRSMDGCRDSEIMMTSWQPDHLATSESIAKSDIHAYRMHIWASITGEMHDEFRDPSNPECVKVMNAIAERNWAKYIGEETVDMTSHLLPFPLEFSEGEIRPRRGLIDGNFPDTKASVLGKKSTLFPELLLT